MSVDWSYSCTRNIFFVLNAVFWVLGCGSIGVGLWVYFTKTDYDGLTAVHHGSQSAVGLCIAAGITVVVVACLGCCGAWMHSKCLLAMYVIVVLIVFAAQVLVIVLGVVYRNDLANTIKLQLYSHLNQEYISDTPLDKSGQRVTWHKLHATFKCCGVMGPQDWYNNTRWPGQQWVPDSCCHPEHFTDKNLENCGKIKNMELLYQEGCFESFSDWLFEHVYVAGIIAVLLIIVQIFGLAAASILFYSIIKKKHRLFCGRNEYELAEMHNLHA